MVILLYVNKASTFYYKFHHGLPRTPPISMLFKFSNLRLYSFWIGDNIVGAVAVAPLAIQFYFIWNLGGVTLVHGTSSGFSVIVCAIGSKNIDQLLKVTGIFLYYIDMK